MAEENNLTEQQSLEIITQMINKAKDDYEETGVGALLWGMSCNFLQPYYFRKFLLAHYHILFYMVSYIVCIDTANNYFCSRSKKKKI